MDHGLCLQIIRIFIMRLSIIVAIAENGAIGKDNNLIYRLPNDLKRFKSLTTGHTIIMGRRTFESLPKGALPNRRNIVLSRSNRDFEGAECYWSLTEALSHCQEDDDVFIIGGASVYQEALPLADRLCLTFIHDTPAEADVFFPEIDFSEWVQTDCESYEHDDRHAVDYSFVDYERKAAVASGLFTENPTDQQMAGESNSPQ